MILEQPLQYPLQRTEQWYQDKLGKLSSSKIAEILPTYTQKGVKKYPATRKTLMLNLIAEELTGIPTEFYQSKRMLRGIELEPEGKADYEALTGSKLIEVGFIDHPHIKKSGCSPDALLNSVGSFELKCPDTSNHILNIIEWLTRYEEYKPQIQWIMACTDRIYCDFYSYDPRCTPRPRVLHRVERDNAYIAMLEYEASLFVDEKEKLRDAITNG